jgi:hypothetical protein
MSKVRRALSFSDFYHSLVPIESPLPTIDYTLSIVNALIDSANIFMDAR